RMQRLGRMLLLWGGLWAALSGCSATQHQRSVPPDPLVSSVGSNPGAVQIARAPQAPQLSVTITAPPAVALRQEIPNTISVANTGGIETQEITVRTTLADGIEYVRSEPPATREGNQLVWGLTGLAGGQRQIIQFVCRSTSPGAVTTTAVASTRDGLRDEK